MCYSSSTSIFAFLTGILSSYLLVYFSKHNDYKIIGYFFLFVSFMQLFDAIFWNFPIHTKINEIATKFAILFNHLQPIILYLLIYYYNKGNIHPDSKTLIQIYCILIIIYTLSVWKKVKYTVVTSRSSPSLDWEWNHQFGYLFVYFVFLITLILLFYQNVKHGGKLAAILTLISFLFSFYKYQSKNITGRFWCYFASFAPLLFLLLK
jgi:hypothetical protein